MKLPTAWTTAGTKKAEPKKVEAKLDMERDDGTCPACRTKMEEPIFCSGKPMRVCWSCRISLPLPDDEHRAAQQEFKPYEENMFGR